MRIWLVIIACMAWLTAPAAWACSVTSDFVRTSTYEMVEQADAVVIATALGRVSQDDEVVSVRFRVDNALKGQPPAEFFAEWADIGRTSRSRADDISEAHPEAFQGPCVRRTFQQGRQYVVFLERDDAGAWRMARHTFWRDAEDYAGPDSLWIETLNLYVGIQAATPDRMAVIDVLAAEMERRTGPSASRRQAAIAADIQDHLSSLSPAKPTEFLVAAYEAIARGEAPRFAVRGLEANQEGGEADALTNLIFDTPSPVFDQTARELYVLRSLVNGDHPDARPLFDRILASSPTLAEQSLAIRWFARNDRLAKALDLIEAGAAGLATADRAEAADFIGTAAYAMNGDVSFEDETEAWTLDPVVASRWPEVVLRLYDVALQRGLGESLENQGTGAFRASFSGDWRADPRLSMALAAGYDEDAELWALAELARTAPTSRIDDPEDPSLLPARMLVKGYGEARDAGLRDGYCRGASGAVMVALAEYGSAYLDDGTLRAMLLDAPDRSAFPRVRAVLESRLSNVSTQRQGWFGSEDEPFREILGLIDGTTASEEASEHLCDNR